MGLRSMREGGGLPGDWEQYRGARVGVGGVV